MAHQATAELGNTTVTVYTREHGIPFIAITVDASKKEGFQTFIDKNIILTTNEQPYPHHKNGNRPWDITPKNLCFIGGGAIEMKAGMACVTITPYREESDANLLGILKAMTDNQLIHSTVTDQLREQLLPSH